MKEIKIYQIDMDRDTNYMMFKDWKRTQPNFDFSIYKDVWAGLVPKKYTLDDVYTMFNINHPQDFRGHSLSVSDIVYMDGMYFFCDSFGWKQIG